MAAEDPMWVRWNQEAPELYNKIAYGNNGIVTGVNLVCHKLMEGQFSRDQVFDRVIEVGAGTGKHLEFVRHRFASYLMTDISERHLRQIAINSPSVRIEVADAAFLPYENSSFDRLISVANLEHLPNPHLVLEEWRRVVRPGGTISISIPTEGGIAWNLGRYLTTRRYFRRMGLDLDYIIAREHINACYRLVSLIRHYFPSRREIWWPFGIPSVNINLIYSCNATR